MRGMIIALLALVLVSADAAHYVPQLLANAQTSANPAPLLWEASQTGSKRAQQALVDYAETHHKPFWLEKLVGLKNPAAAWALYQRMPLDNRQPALLSLAANGNVPEAQLALAMSTDTPEQREKWLVKAAKQQYLPAQAALADWYLLNQAPAKARQWLVKTAEQYPQSAYQLGRLLWDEGKFTKGKALLGQAASQGHELAQRLTQVLSVYKPVRPASVGAVNWPEQQQCRQRIQMFATSLSSIERASQLYRQFAGDKRLASLPLCIQPPVWLANNTLKCDSNLDNSGRLGCDLRPLAGAIEQRDATHIIVVADLGKANVHNGAMYLDLSDSYSVMVHELAHFAGFIDEYPLPSPIAQQHCTQPDAPNLVTDGKLTYAPQSTLERWQNVSGALQIAPSKTCEAIGQPAYKPSQQITFLEHHDSGVIPGLYLQLWQQQLARPDQQRPIYMNLFQRFHYAGNTPQAGKWLKKYNSFNSTDKPTSSSTKALEE